MSLCSRPPAGWLCFRLSVCPCAGPRGRPCPPPPLGETGRRLSVRACLRLGGQFARRGQRGRGPDASPCCRVPSCQLTALPLPPSSSFCPSGPASLSLGASLTSLHCPPHHRHPSPAPWPAEVSPGCRAKPAASRARRTACMVTGGQWWRAPRGGFIWLQLARGRGGSTAHCPHGRPLRPASAAGRRAGPHLQLPCPAVPSHSLCPSFCFRKAGAAQDGGHRPHPQPSSG